MKFGVYIDNSFLFDLWVVVKVCEVTNYIKWGRVVGCCHILRGK